jgi:hypothetical protein
MMWIKNLSLVLKPSRQGLNDPDNMTTHGSRPDPKTRIDNRRRHGIDLKNPFTMSKTHTASQGRVIAAHSMAAANSLLHHLDILVMRCPLRRQSQQSCALWRAMQRWPPLS